MIIFLLFLSTLKHVPDSCPVRRAAKALGLAIKHFHMARADLEESLDKSMMGDWLTRLGTTG
jgi:hypothetical protein